MFCNHHYSVCLLLCDKRTVGDIKVSFRMRFLLFAEIMRLMHDANMSDCIFNTLKAKVAILHTLLWNTDDYLIGPYES